VQATIGHRPAQGYSSGEGIYEDLLEMIDREVEGSESLEVCRNTATSPSQRIILPEQAFLVMHSIAGGSGSGLGSFFFLSASRTGILRN
jgi:tubulin gamma